AVPRHQQSREILAGLAERVEQLVDPRLERVAPWTMPPNAVGVCRVSIDFPLPRYMWTPHGRHGSKLRTARMMSMPLNLSGGFSSKIGVFLHAASSMARVSHEA